MIKIFQLILGGLTSYLDYHFILPVFAFANAGIIFAGINFETITLGIILGLFFGKQLSIFSILAILKKLKLFKLGESLSNLQLYGISLLWYRLYHEFVYRSFCL
ncbi:MAG: Na+/H+ antiporter NhaA [Francisella endosymbiont of Hyalomma scupense]